MACQMVHWLIAGAGPTTFQHALVGIGCLLAYDAAARWWNRGRRPAEDESLSPRDQISQSDSDWDYRQAA